MQVRYQLYYRIRRWFGKGREIISTGSAPVSNKELNLIDSIPSDRLYENRTFTFLNQSKHFREAVDWNFSEFGKLWTYNLNYFEYLLQADTDSEKGLNLIYDFIENTRHISTGMEPYPISLRTVNWIKFCLEHEIEDPRIDASLYAQFQKLANNVEYHLMGNHLLENGCSLLAGAIYFKDTSFLKTAREILFEQLDEQVMNDGGHFERSPMYHQILLHRLLDCYNLARNQEFAGRKLLNVIENKIELMLGWINAVTFENGDIPRVNDTTNGIAPSTAELNDYAGRLGLKSKTVKLGESGYRMIRHPGLEWFIDVGEIGPDYIPGHAHSDTFSFVLHIRNKPVIVDTGISTYEHCERRIEERSTSAHNTVMLDGREQSEIWHSFRVGRRAHIVNLEEEKSFISAEHDGYDWLGLRHKRTFKWDTGRLTIIDEIIGDRQNSARAHLHFHPDVKVEKTGEAVAFNDGQVKFSGHESINLKSYDYASGFNLVQTAAAAEIKFKNRLETEIIL